MSLPVFYHSGMAGFPAAASLTTAGGYLAVLDACLVNGTNLVTAVTLTQTGGVATATFAGNHNFSVGDSVLVEGATPAGYNGRMKVTAKAADSISFAVDSGLTTPATGTITVKHPGAGWTKTWSDGNKAAYRSATTDGGVGAYLQIEDDDPYADSFVSLRFRACEGHTGLDTATRLATEPRRFWKMPSNTSWWFAADDRTFYLGTGTAAYPAMFMAGEITSSLLTDDGAWVFPAPSSTTYHHNGGRGVTMGTRADRPASEYALQALKTWAGLATTPEISPTIAGGFGNTGNSADLGPAQALNAAPNPLTGAVELVQVRAVESVQKNTTVGSALTRGTFRGVYQLLGQLPSGMFTNHVVRELPNAEIGGVPRNIAVVRTGVSFTSQIAFDLTGPWG